MTFIQAMNLAKTSIYIQTLNFVLPIMADLVVEACLRGVQVTIVTSYKYGDRAEKMDHRTLGTNRDTAEYMYKKLKSKDPSKLGLLKVLLWNGSRGKPQQPTKAECDRKFIFECVF